MRRWSGMKLCAQNSFCKVLFISMFLFCPCKYSCQKTGIHLVHNLGQNCWQRNREYFMESAGVRYLRTSCWRIRNRTSERSERVRFLIQKQRVHKYRTKHFPCGIVFILYILRLSSFWRPFYFKSFKNAKICRYTVTAKWQRKRSISFVVKTFVENINYGEDMR